MSRTEQKKTLLVKNVIVSLTDNPNYPDYSTFRLRQGSEGYFLSFELAAEPNLKGIKVHDHRFFVVDAFRTLIRQPFDPEKLPVRLHQAVYWVRNVINSTAQVHVRQNLETGEYFITLHMVRGGTCDGLLHYEIDGSDYQGDALLVDSNHPYLVMTDPHHRAIIHGRRNEVPTSIFLGGEKQCYPREDIDSILILDFLEKGEYPTLESIKQRKRVNQSSK